MAAHILRPRSRGGPAPIQAVGPRVRWREIEAGAHLPEVQAFIREEIARGTIRVLPDVNGGVRIAPISPPRR